MMVVHHHTGQIENNAFDILLIIFDDKDVL